MNSFKQSMEDSSVMSTLRQRSSNRTFLLNLKFYKCIRMGYFRVNFLLPLYQNESKCETIVMKMSLKLQAELIFMRMVLHLDSF